MWDFVNTAHVLSSTKARAKFFIHQHKSMVRLSQEKKKKSFSLKGEVHVLISSKCYKVIKGDEQSCSCRGFLFHSVQSEWVCHSKHHRVIPQRNIPGHPGFC